MGIQTYGILYPPYDAVKLTTSVDGFTSIPQGYNWGVVDAVNYANTRVTTGNTVLFRQQDAILVTAGGTNYYIIDEEKLIFKGNVAV